MKKRVIIYHDDADGRCAAAIAGRHGHDNRYEVEYMKAEHGAGPQWDKLMMLRRNKDEIWVVDFSFEENDMLALVLIVGKSYLYWFDHHKTAIEKLRNMVTVPGLRNLEWAACMLVWIWCSPGLVPPPAVKYIADRDLWRFKYGDTTKDFYEMYLQAESHPCGQVWDLYFTMPEEQYRKYIAHGRILRTARIQQLKSFALSLGQQVAFILGENQYTAKGLKVNYPGSGDMGQVIKDLGYDVAWCYVEKMIEGRLVRDNSLYSDTFDVSAIATARGGGGHAGAAGYVEVLQVDCDAPSPS